MALPDQGKAQKERKIGLVGVHHYQLFDQSNSSSFRWDSLDESNSSFFRDFVFRSRRRRRRRRRRRHQRNRCRYPRRGAPLFGSRPWRRDDKNGHDVFYIGDCLSIRNQGRMREGGSRGAGESANTSQTQNDEGLIRFDSVLNDAASYVAHTTSYFTSCFSDSSVDTNPRQPPPTSSASHEEELVTFASTQSAHSPPTTTAHQSSITTESPEPAIAPPALHTTPEDSSAPPTTATATAALQLSNNTARNGISIFQSLIDRALRTVRGSAEDIGWLQTASGMPPVEDGTHRFLEILQDIRHGIPKLPKSVVYLLVPGLFSNHGPLYFVDTKTRFSKMGLTCHIAKIHSESSVEKNAREIKEYVEEIYWGSGKRVLILGHSKGGVDAAAALSLYWSDLREKVAGLALAQSPYGGSPIASDILREGQLGDYVNVRKLMEILICKVIKGDMQALEDLTYERRKRFLMQHHLPAELPVVSFHTEASISPAVLATLSRVAHAELPAPLSTAQAAKLPVVVPLGAAMAACAQLLQIRYKEKSDGLVTCRDAEVPGSTVVRPTRKLDHAWMVYSSLNDDTSEADASQVCEALLTLVVEVGLKKRHQLTNKDE